VPAIIDEEAFNRVQAALKARSPKATAPRSVNDLTMLASVARCAECGAAMILNTGKGGSYRYYSCSKAMKQGKTACRGRFRGGRRRRSGDQRTELAAVVHGPLRGVARASAIPCDHTVRRSDIYLR